MRKCYQLLIGSAMVMIGRTLFPYTNEHMQTIQAQFGLEKMNLNTIGYINYS